MKSPNDGRFDYEMSVKVSVIKKKDHVCINNKQTNPAVIDIFNGLKKLRSLRFELRDEVCALRLAETLDGYRMCHSVPVKVVTSGNIVYAYRIAQH